MRRGARVRARLRESAAQREGDLFAADVDEVPDHRVGHRPVVQRSHAGGLAVGALSDGCWNCHIIVQRFSGLYEAMQRFGSGNGQAETL